MHGGASPTHIKAAQRRDAERAVASLGLPREVEPHMALLEEVQRAAGHVAWLADVVRQLDKNQVVHGIMRTVQLPDGGRMVEGRAAIDIWVKLYQEWHDRLVRVAKTAIDAGVEERQVRGTGHGAGCPLPHPPAQRSAGRASADRRPPHRRRHPALHAAHPGAPDRPRPTAPAIRPDVALCVDAAVFARTRLGSRLALAQAEASVSGARPPDASVSSFAHTGERRQRCRVTWEAELKRAPADLS